MEDFILMNQEHFPELVNFMGFAGETEDIEMDQEGGKPLYEEHFPFSDMVLGIKQGKFF